jgi:hypothetical protein
MGAADKLDLQIKITRNAQYVLYAVSRSTRMEVQVRSNRNGEVSVRLCMVTVVRLFATLTGAWSGRVIDERQYVVYL